MPGGALLLSRALSLAALLLALPLAAQGAGLSTWGTQVAPAPAGVAPAGPLAGVWSALQGLWDRAAAALAPAGGPARGSHPPATAGGSARTWSKTGQVSGPPGPAAPGGGASLSDDSGASIDPHG